jgi:hypothetical protein
MGGHHLFGEIMSWIAPTQPHPHPLVVFFAPNYFHVASGTRRVCRKSTSVLGRVMRQNVGSGNNNISQPD